MSTSNQTFFRSVVSRLRPPPNPDSPSSDVTARANRYGEFFESAAVRKSHVLADEGTYFVAATGPGGSLNGQASSGFAATLPFIVIQNTDSSGSDVRIYLDYLHLITLSAPTGTLVASPYTALTVVTDAGLRTSTGNILSPVCPNQDITPSSVAAVYGGSGITATAPTSRARMIVGNRNLRFAVTNGVVFDVIGDTKTLVFGNVESSPMQAGSGASLQVAPGAWGTNLPPAIIGPQESILIYLWYSGATGIGFGAYGVEMGWWER